MAEKKNPLMDLFKVEKDNSYRTVIHKPMSEEEVKRKEAECEAFWNSDNTQVHEEELSNNYAKAYKEKEEVEISRRLMQTSLNKERKQTVRRAEGSHMSGLESLISLKKEGPSTIYTQSVMTVTTSEMNSEIKRPENLRDHYNFDCKRWKTLPIDKERELIVNMIHTNQVTIVSGHTGCGKTTRIPQFIIDDAAEKNEYVNIVVTQPRRIAAQTVARRVSEERGWPLGRLVGYKVGLDKNNCSTDTRLLYCTTGVLKKMIVSRKTINNYSHVILDEVHEREEDMDFLLLLCKKLINSNSGGVRLILMSATLTIGKLADYFSYTIPIQEKTVIKPGVIEISPNSKMYDVQTFYSESLGKYFNMEKAPDFEEGPKLFPFSVELCRRLLLELDNMEAKLKNNREYPGTVLVFLPGEYEITTVNKVLHEEMRKDWNIYILHSKIPLDDMMLIFRNPEPRKRKIILATNMAESSITIPDVEYVIDFALTKFLVANTMTNYTALQLNWADRQSMKQRAGRAGRVQNGQVFILIPKSFYENHLVDAHPAEMTRAPLDKVILDTKLLDFGSPKELLALALDPPNLRNIHKTVMALKEIGALLPTVNQVAVRDDGDLTLLGELLASLPVDVRLGKLIFLGHLLDVLDDCLIIAACMSNKSIFATPMNDKLEAYAYKLFWSDGTFSDCLAALRAFKTYQNLKDEGYFKRSVPSNKNTRDQELEWCRARFLQKKCLGDVEKTLEELRLRLDSMEIKKHATPNRQGLQESEKLRFLQIAIFGAFFPHYFEHHGDKQDLFEVHKSMNGKDPMSSVFISGFPTEHVKFKELFTSNIKELVQECQPNPDLIDLDFLGNKVVITFAKNKRKKIDAEKDQFDFNRLNREVDLTGEISHNVYIAVKMRHLRRQLETEFPTLETAEQLSNDLALLKKEAQKKNRQSVITFDQIGIVDPPGIDVERCNFDVVHVNDPNSIWVQYVDEKSVSMLNEITLAIANLIESNLCKHPKEISIDGIYLALYEEDGFSSYYRARVDSIRRNNKGRMAIVMFVDFGNTEMVPVNDLLEIPMDSAISKPLFEVPALALECSMAKIRPNPAIHAGGLWHESAKKLLKDVLLHKTVVAEVYSVIPGKESPLIKVTFFISDDFCVNNMLLDTDIHYPSFAVRVSESYLSDLNKGKRSQSQFLNEIEKKSIEKEQSATFRNKKELKNFDITPYCSTKKTLKGPFSPLEFRINGVVKIGGRLETRIDMESVNSVLLDRFPHESSSQWLVAAQVAMNPRGNALLLRSTTFLPNQLGLGAILAMAFAPCVEMRCDKKKQRYTGFIAGLGEREKDWGMNTRQGHTASYRANQKVAYYPDHDMEIAFDTSIDQDDVRNINMIRFNLNKALTSAPISPNDVADENTSEYEQRHRIRITHLTNLEKLVEIQENLHKYFRAVLDKPRHHRDKIFFNHEFEWSRLAPEDSLGYPKLSDAHLHIFKMIPLINLVSSSDSVVTSEKVFYDLKEFHDKARKSLREIREICPICPQKQVLRTSEHIKSHIQGKVHQKYLDRM